jgi:stalled ribosome alternative rescue factor ArfA
MPCACFGAQKGAPEMKYRLTRKETAPPNLAAKALRNGLFRPKVEKNPDAYSRKQKHRKGSLEDVQLPFLLEGIEEGAVPEEEADAASTASFPRRRKSALPGE